MKHIWLILLFANIENVEKQKTVCRPNWFGQTHDVISVRTVEDVNVITNTSLLLLCLSSFQLNKMNSQK